MIDNVNHVSFLWNKSNHSNNQIDLTIAPSIFIELLKIFGRFRDLGEKSRNRKDYILKFVCLIMKFYGYNKFMTKSYVELLPPVEIVEELEANEMNRPITIRVNTLKTKRTNLLMSLINRGFTLSPFGNWSKVGLVVYNSTVPLGCTPEYLAGHYILQSASSFLPCLALSPEYGEKLLDLSAAPGGKTTYLAALMHNSGIIFANEINRKRIKSITTNIQRMGVSNTIICNYEGLDLCRVIGKNTADRVLLDAPCSGTGILSKYPRIKKTKNKEDIWKCSYLQRQLILQAIDMTDSNSRSGGFIVYSTCSLLVEENEMVIDYALRKREVRLVSTNLQFGSLGLTKYREFRFHPSLKNTRRFSPHIHNLDSFFVCKLRKNSSQLIQNPSIRAINIKTDGKMLPLKTKQTYNHKTTRKNVIFCHHSNICSKFILSRLRQS